MEWTHASQHPSSVLSNLQAFDIHPSHDHAHRRGQSKQPDKHLRLDWSAERPTRDHEPGYVSQRDQQDDHISIDAMQHERFVSQHRRELYGC